jgi:hypothetical protein
MHMRNDNNGIAIAQCAYACFDFCLFVVCSLFFVLNSYGHMFTCSVLLFRSVLLPSLTITVLLFCVNNNGEAWKIHS